MLSSGQIECYRENGYLGVENVFSPERIAAVRAVVDEFVERSREVTDHTAVYDLEPGHSAAAPRVRRLKNTVTIHPIFEELARSDSLLDIVASLIGPEIRLHGSKLNMKSPGYGSAVEWHQDFAFYPHTNDDLLAVGIALDDCSLENGCILMMPGSHRGQMLNHHQDGIFMGAIDPAHEGIDLSRAVPVPVRAGGITIHHCRTLHGSQLNTSSTPRRLILLEFAAVDAFPVTGVADLAEFDSRIWRGQPTSTYRVTEMDIRLPLPKHARAGSIYEIQTPFKAKVFQTAAAD